MSWNKDQVIALINAIKENPCLYDTNNKDFKSRRIRVDVLNSLVEQFSEIRPGTSNTDLKKKWTGLRKTYLSEKRRGESKKNDGNSEVFSSSLFYFQDMSFLDDHLSLEVKKLKSNPEDEWPDMIVGETSSAEDETIASVTTSPAITHTSPAITQTLPASLLGATPAITPSVTPATINNVKRRRKKDISEDPTVMEIAASALKLLNKEDDETRYGKTVADRLRQFTKVERVWIKKKIDDILFSESVRKYYEDDGAL